jgi:colanic acid biosynthesis glycosyl transferase WcaI
MRILIVTPYYAPDLGPSAPLVAMLAEDLTQLGHKVTVMAAVPHFPSGQVSPEYRGRLWQWSEEHGVRVCRVRVPSGRRANLRHRLLTFLVFQVSASLAGLRLAYDAALITNPALETGLPFALLAWLRRKPCLFSVWDLYPEVGVRLGIFRKPLARAVVGAIEDFCLRRAAAVQVLSEGFGPALQARGVAARRLVVIPPWLDTEFIRPLPRSNPFSCEHGLDGCFVVMYAGNLGLSQGLEGFLQAAQLLADQPSIQFVLVGDGANREALERQAAASQLDNVRFLPFQPRERLPEVLASADVSVVSLRPGTAGDSLPSKVFPLLASGRPIIAAVDEGSDVCRLVEHAGAGIGVPPADPRRLAEAIECLAGQPGLRDEMGRKARDYAVEHFHRRGAAERFEAALQQSLLDHKIGLWPRAIIGSSRMTRMDE